MKKMRVKVGKKGQVTLPQPLRESWCMEEGSELSITAEGDRAIIRPVRRTRLEDDAGSLGKPDSDEVEFATVDAELVSEHYSRKYRR